MLEDGLSRFALRKINLVSEFESRVFINCACDVPSVAGAHTMRFLAVLFATSLAALVASSPVIDTGSRSIVLNTQQELFGGDDEKECQPYGTLCDWPSGARGPCCAPLLCRPITMPASPYKVCS